MAIGTLIAPLVSGFSDAASGTAYAYRRDTDRGTAISMYSDPQATESLGTSEPLDANGRLVAFVKEEAEIVIRNASGVEVIAFPTGISGAMVGLESAAFTGTLSTGLQGAGGLTDISTALARLLVSFGTTDGKVIPAGSGSTAQNLKAALAIQSGLPFYDVSSSTYGAVGDNATNNAAFIQAAINAANTAGGGIVFVPVDSSGGIYRVSSALTLKSKVKLLLAPGAIIRGTFATVAGVNGVIIVNTGSTAESGCEIEGGTIDASNASPAACIRGGANSSGLAVRNVTITASGSASGGTVDMTLSGAANTRATFVNVICGTPAAPNGTINLGKNNLAIGCVFDTVSFGNSAQGDNSAYVGGTCDHYTVLNSSNYCGVYGTKITDPTTCTLAGASGVTFINLSVGDTTLSATYTGGAGQLFGIKALTMGTVRDTTNPATFTPDPFKGRNHVESNANITIANATNVQDGQMLFLTIVNNKGSAMTVTYGTDYNDGDTSIATGKVLHQIFVYDNTATQWHLFAVREVP